MRRCQSRPRWLVLLCAVFGLLTLNCGGGDGHEVVHLHVFNAYPGSQSMSLYGPSGTIVTDLPFGTRTDSPVAVDRNLGTEFELVLDGAPTTFELDQELYNLYPEETATFLFSRRQNNTVHAQILRHVQSVSPACRLVFHNSLAVSNDQIGIYHFIVGWNFQHQIAEAGYNESAEDQFINEHIDDLDPEHIENHEERREELYGNIDYHPVFSLAEGVGAEEEVGTLKFVWLGEEFTVERPRVDFESGSIRTHPPTEEYIECLEGVLEGEDADAGGGLGDDEEEDTQDCTEEQVYNTPSYGPGADQVGGIIHYFPESLPNTLQDGSPRSEENACAADLRIYSDFANIFSGEHGFENRPPFIDEFSEAALNQEEDPLVRLFPRFSRSDHQFYVLYGRPVHSDQVRIEQWKASDQFEDMRDYP